MKLRIITFLFILAAFCFNHSLYADKLLTLFLKPYPMVSTQNASEKLGPKLDRFSKLANTQSKRMLPASVSGIFATYGGFLTISDLNGEISFPLLHKGSFIYLLITERLSPIVMSGNTISHWEMIDDIPAELYRIEQKWDPETKLNYWDVTQEPLPKNNRFPIESIALFADPKYVYVPLGISLLHESPHLILPDIYIKQGINLTAQALFILNLTHYFGGILPIYKKEKVRYSRHLTY